MVAMGEPWRRCATVGGRSAWPGHVRRQSPGADRQTAPDSRALSHHHPPPCHPGYVPCPLELGPPRPRTAPTRHDASDSYAAARADISACLLHHADGQHPIVSGSYRSQSIVHDHVHAILVPRVRRLFQNRGWHPGLAKSAAARSRRAHSTADGAAAYPTCSAGSCVCLCTCTEQAGQGCRVKFRSRSMLARFVPSMCP